MAVEMNEKTNRFSYNQIKNQLSVFISPVISFTITTDQNQQVELSGETLVEYLMTNLPRKQILELLDMLEIIKNRNSETMNYIHYILQGINPKKS